MQNRLTVSLSDRSYDILIGEGAIENLGEFLSQKNYSKIIVITDRNVAKAHMHILSENLPAFEQVVVEAGEQTKSFSALEKTCEEILAKGIDRKSAIIAFGGGVVGDFAGFIASILLRGVDFIQIPTTLLSCVDSSVGGKCAINSISGKNLIGSFYQPKLVICDIKFLKTLDDRQLKAGYAEVVKYGLIKDLSFFEFLEKNYGKVFNRDKEVLAHIIKRSCEIKADIVSRDEKESGERALLNFGHTFGHIFETETNYSNEVLHGEAVSLGMIMAAKMSQQMGLINENDFFRILTHFQNCSLIVSPSQVREKWNLEALVSHLFKDKKHESGKLTFILLQKIGQAFIEKDVDLERFKATLSEFF